MRCNQVVVDGKVKRWCGSMAEARAAKKEIVEATGVKASAVSYREGVEVPSDKVGLLEFLNKNLIES